MLPQLSDLQFFEVYCAVWANLAFHLSTVSSCCTGVDSMLLCVRNLLWGRAPRSLTLRNLLMVPSRVPAARRQTCSQHSAWLVFWGQLLETWPEVPGWERQDARLWGEAAWLSALLFLSSPLPLLRGIRDTLPPLRLFGLKHCTQEVAEILMCCQNRYSEAASERVLMIVMYDSDGWLHSALQNVAIMMQHAKRCSVRYGENTD